MRKVIVKPLRSKGSCLGLDLVMEHNISGELGHKGTPKWNFEIFFTF